MKTARIFKVGLALAVAAFCITPASAQTPCANSQVLGTALGSPLTDCMDGAPIAGFAYALGSTANMGDSNIICEAEGEAAQGNTGCFGASGPGDGLISIDANWANAGALGCPNAAGQPGVGRNVVVIRDNVGGSVILSIGYDINSGGYIAEYAFDSTTFALSYKSGDGRDAASKGIVIRGAVKSGDDVTTTAVVDAQAVAPTVFTDCDPSSVGIAFGTGTCTEGNVSFDRGNVYYRSGECDTRGLDLRRAGWTAVPTGPDGSAPFTASYPSGQCLYVGSSLLSGTTESPSVVAAASIAGNLAASPRALGVRAKQAGGDVVVDFHTISEVGLIGFEVETKGGRRIGTLIAGKGVSGGGATYSVSLKRGDFKNERELYVVAVTNASRTKSDLVSF